VLGYRHIEVAPVQVSACCDARVLWRFDQFNGRAAIRLGFATHFSLLCTSAGCE